MSFKGLKILIGGDLEYFRVKYLFSDTVFSFNRHFEF